MGGELNKWMFVKCLEGAWHIVIIMKYLLNKIKFIYCYDLNVFLEASAGNLIVNTTVVLQGGIFERW